MQPSPIQLKDMSYIGFKVWARSLTEDEQASIDKFDFNDVMIGESIEFAALGDQDDPENYAVKLKITINNEEGKKAPYDVDVEVAGFFSISKKTPIADREDFIVVNGCAILYGAIRDLVLNLTSRSGNGSLLLPTVNFLDHRKRNKESKSQ